MSRQLFMLLGVLSIQIYATFGAEDRALDKRAATEQGIKLDDKPYGIAESIKNAKDMLLEGQRQKRFFDYIGYSTGASSFSSIYPSVANYASSDTPYGTNIPNEQNKLTEILKILRMLAAVTRPQYSPPVNHHNTHYPVFIPLHFISQSGCTCTQSNANNPANIPPPAPQTTNLPPATNYIPSSTDKSENKTMPDPTVAVNTDNRFGAEQPTKKPNTDVSDDYEDGVRPISFDPIPPKVPQSVEPPPVEHGSFQAGLDLGPTEFNPPRDVAPPENKLENVPLKASMPSICEAAIITCCHRPEVTSDCFAKEGCGEIEYGNPCDATVLSKIVSKFRAYFMQRG